MVWKNLLAHPKYGSSNDKNTEVKHGCEEFEENYFMNKRKRKKQYFQISVTLPWPVWLSWLEHHPITKWLQVRFPIQECTIPGLGVDDPWSGHMGGNESMLLSHICVSLSPFLSL